ncbi:hypothetical protein [Pedobacter puniceum]|jgi:uncharacterized membrane protein YidH (DUF202 family)|uniref:Uncharacterized protein n=1 Tax=Pedobacter puniceum TaxID=2666136 RepID=A0A7K0FUH6_9SPHI|nr:hypothetical protein [Pedobacter puniceum]MRX48797.1 hypothetical protein [Pedobacter puniceum]
MKEKYLEDIKEIKEIMNRSTRFISLSGLSGVSTGLIALVGVAAAYLMVFQEQNWLIEQAVSIDATNLFYLLLIAVVTLGLSIGSAIFFTTQKAIRQSQKVWDQQSKRLLVNLSIPLVTGGLLCLLLLYKGFVGFLPALTLVFYGLALINASKYTWPELRNLGLFEIVLGLLAIQFIAYSLLMWALGFGVIQVIYGLIVQKKYK